MSHKEDNIPRESSFRVQRSVFGSGRRRELTADEYFAGVRAGDVAILARALTLIESSSPRHQPLAEELLTRLLPHIGRSITGNRPSDRARAGERGGEGCH